MSGDRGRTSRESHKMCCGLHVNIQIAAQLRCVCVCACVCTLLWELASSCPMNFAEFQLGILSAYCLIIILLAIYCLQTL